MSLTGEPDRDPVRSGVSLVDIITGLFAGQAVLAALYERTRSGKGQFVDVPLFDTSVNMLSHAASAYLIDGKVMGRVGNSNENAMPVGLYHATDGAFTLAMTTDRQFERFCGEVLERPDMAANPDFKDNASRVRNRARLDAILVEIFAQGPRAQWLERCAKAGIPAGPMRDVAEALNSPEVEGRDLITEATHTSIGRIPQVRSPMRFARTPVVDPVGAPLLGEHTETVLRDLLGYDDAAITRLREAGTIL
jgi:crotonobetainyl-CoA:carnitine CoA-transferase CaiB-like acyl-CoA transferase